MFKTIYLNLNPRPRTSVSNPTNIGEKRAGPRRIVNVRIFFAHKTRQKQGVTPEKVIKPSPPQVSTFRTKMVELARGEPGMPLSCWSLTLSGYQTKKNHTAVANLKEASILRAFIRFIRGHTGEPKHRLERGIAYWHFLIEGPMRGSQNKKEQYFPKSHLLAP